MVGFAYFRLMKEDRVLIHGSAPVPHSGPGTGVDFGNFWAPVEIRAENRRALKPRSGNFRPGADPCFKPFSQTSS